MILIMKKIYQVPALTVAQMAECLPIAASEPDVTYNPNNSVAAEEVEVKGSGDWGDIWE